MMPLRASAPPPRNIITRNVLRIRGAWMTADFFFSEDDEEDDPGSGRVATAPIAAELWKTVDQIRRSQRAFERSVRTTSAALMSRMPRRGSAHSPPNWAGSAPN